VRPTGKIRVTYLEHGRKTPHFMMSRFIEAPDMPFRDKPLRSGHLAAAHEEA
jgi:hypothetical protein